MSEVVMYCTRFCPYCIRAEQLLKRKGVEIKIISVDNKPDLWYFMVKISGRNTVPLIFFGEYHVGGFDEMVELDMDDELYLLLEPILEAMKLQG